MARTAPTDGSKARSFPIRDSRGRILKWYGAGTDVNDLKLSEQQRQQTFDWLSAALDQLAEGFFALDTDGKFTFFNGAAERMLERDRHRVIGKRLFEVFPHFRASVLQQKIDQAHKENAMVPFDTQIPGAEAAGRYRGRVWPRWYDEGVSVFFERRAEKGGASV